MLNKVRAFLLSLTITAVLVFSAVGTTVVYADGGITPDQPPAETSTEEPSSEEPAGEEGKSGPGTVDTVERPEPDPVVTEVPAEEPTPAPTEEAAPPAKKKTKKTVSNSPILSTVPEKTRVIVLNA